MKKVLITGATGFVGKAFVQRLVNDQQLTPVLLVRQHADLWPDLQQQMISDLTATEDFSTALNGIDIVVHIAGRAHILKETAAEPLEAFRDVNVKATLTLAKQALEAGVKRFIFISSIGVNGNTSQKPFTEEDKPAPESPYAISKYEAEQALFELTHNSDMDLVIIRPPLVYGEGVKANFYTLLKWVKKGIPLPLDAIHNKRSFVALDNLVDLMTVCLTHPHAANQVFLVADKEVISTPDLLRKCAHFMDKKIRLLPVPAAFLKGMASLVGKKHMAKQLCDSLEVVIAKAQRSLNWQPIVTLDEGLKKVVADFLTKDKV